MLSSSSNMGALARALSGELSPRTASKRTLKHKMETRSRMRVVCCAQCGDTQTELRKIKKGVYACVACLKIRAKNQAPRPTPPIAEAA